MNWGNPEGGEHGPATAVASMGGGQAGPCRPHGGGPFQLTGVFEGRSCDIFEASRRPQTHNAARAEYVRSAALRIKLGPEIPSGDMSAQPVPRFM